jgi:protein phosphatase
MVTYANAQSASPSQDLSPTLPMKIWGATDKGRQREGNEDSVYPHSEVETFQPSAERLEYKGQLLIVADGVGGAQAGAEASRWAIRVAVERYYDLDGASPGEDLRTAIEIANNSLNQYLQSTGTREAGSTMAAVVIHRNRLYVANVGDSRVYLLRNGELRQLTTDHTLTQRKIDQGIIRSDQADMDPDQSVLTRSMGAGPSVDVDLLSPRQLESGDVVLLCSDGLTDMLSDAEIAHILGNNSPKRAAQKLIRDANRAGGFDNISVVIAQVGGRPKGTGGPAFLDEFRANAAKLATWQKLVLAGLAAALLVVCTALGWLASATVLDMAGDPTATAEPPTATLAAPTATTEATAAPEETATPPPTDTVPAGQPTSTPRPTSTPTNTPDPDPDRDGFIGNDDLCPYDWGTAQGCPDADGDGVRDNLDGCPNEYAETGDGCPLPTLTPEPVSTSEGGNNGNDGTDDDNGQPDR